MTEVEKNKQYLILHVIYRNIFTVFCYKKIEHLFILFRRKVIFYLLNKSVRIQMWQTIYYDSESDNIILSSLFSLYVIPTQSVAWKKDVKEFTGLQSRFITTEVKLMRRLQLFQIMRSGPLPPHPTWSYVLLPLFPFLLGPGLSKILLPFAVIFIVLLSFQIPNNFNLIFSNTSFNFWNPTIFLTT